MKLLLTSYSADVLHKAARFFPKEPKDCNILCITTASKVEDGPKEWLDAELGAYKKLGFKLTVIDIDGMTEPELSALMEKADIIFGTGGNTFFLLEKMRACNFEEHLRHALVRGAMYIGSSASSIVCCPDIDYVRTLDEPEKSELKDTQGMGFINFYLAVHMNQPFFAEKFHQKISELETSSIPVICLNDDQALYIDGAAIKVI